MPDPVAHPKAPIHRIAPVLALALLMGGCAVGPVFFEKGVASQDSAQAVLVLGNENGDVVVRQLDGTELANPYTTWNGGYSAVRELRLIPGRHRIEGMVGISGAIQYFDMTETFEPGARYRISPKLQGYRLSADFRRIDGGSSP